jgi:hypothetical protein
MSSRQTSSKPRRKLTPPEKAQAGLVLIYEAILELLADNPNGLSHVAIARELKLELSYHGGSNWASQTILHQLVYSGEVEKLGNGAQATYRKSK